jgi:hypothetical protein
MTQHRKGSDAESVARLRATASSVAVSGGFDSNSGDQGVSRGRLDFSGDRFNAKETMLVNEGLDPVVMVTKKDELLAAPGNDLIYGANLTP